MAPVKRTNILDEIAGPSGLTDADWAEIDKLKKAFDTGGERALSGVDARKRALLAPVARPIDTGSPDPFCSQG
jgi:hypothetical protein